MEEPFLGKKERRTNLVGGWGFLYLLPSLGIFGIFISLVRSMIQVFLYDIL